MLGPLWDNQHNSSDKYTWLFLISITRCPPGHTVPFHLNITNSAVLLHTHINKTYPDERLLAANTQRKFKTPKLNVGLYFLKVLPHLWDVHTGPRLWMCSYTKDKAEWGKKAEEIASLPSMLSLKCVRWSEGFLMYKLVSVLPVSPLYVMVSLLLSFSFWLLSDKMFPFSVSLFLIWT